MSIDTLAAGEAEVAAPELQLQLPYAPPDVVPASNAVPVQPSIEAMLADAVSLPALPTLTGAPPGVERRAMEQCVLALQHMNEEYRQRTCDRARATQASRWVWIMPSLLLRRPPARDMPENDAHGGRIAPLPSDSVNPAADLSLTKLLKKRVQLAECGQWDVLLEEYLRDRKAVEEREATRLLSQGAPPRDDDVRVFQRVIAMIHDDCVSRAKR